MGDSLEEDPAATGNDNDNDPNDLHESSMAPLLSGRSSGTPTIRPREATVVQMSNLDPKEETLNKDLYNACSSGDYENVQKLLRQGAKPMPCDASEEESPVYITCKNGYFSILDLLLNNLEANVGLISFWEFSDKYGNSFFHIIIKNISKNKANVDTLESVDYKQCLDNILKYVNDEKYGNTKFIKKSELNLLVDACEEGLEEFVDRLLKDGADPTKYLNREKKGALQISGSKGYDEIFKSILNKIKDLDKLEYGLKQKDKFGNSVLHAIVKGLEKEVKSAKRKNEDRNEEVIDKFIECMRVLFADYENYIDIDAVNNRGSTALHTAALLKTFHDESRPTDILVNHGANKDIKNKEGKNALDHQPIMFAAAAGGSMPKLKGLKIKSDSLKRGLTDESYDIRRAEDLYYACESGILDQVKCYVEIADCTMLFKEKEEKTAIRVAFRKGYFNVIDLLLKHMKKVIDLDQVIAIVKRLSHDLNKKNDSIIEDEDIDYNRCLDILVTQNHLFSNVLYAACEKGDAYIVRKLLGKSIDPTVSCQQNKEICPIIVAFNKGYHEIAEMLLKKTKEISKLQEVIQENIINDIITDVINGGFLKKEKHRKDSTKKVVHNVNEVVDFGEAFGVLLYYLELESFVLKNRNEILYDVCEKGLPIFVQKLIDFNVDPATKCGARLENYPLIIAARKGYSDILEIILNKLENNKLKYCLRQRTDRYQHSALHVIMRRDKENSGSDKDYLKCLNVLMKNKHNFDIDAKDKAGNTALHYAVRLRGDWTFSKILIKNGACINVKNREGICVINRIPVNTIEDILNECIKESNFSEGRENENYELMMDFGVFSHKESLETRSESELITSLRKSPSHHHLLYHPLITSFTHIKWQKVKYSWYLDILWSIIFFFLIFFYILYYGSSQFDNGVIDEEREIEILPLKIMITIFGLVIMIREILQLIVLKWDYFKSIENYLELSILVLTCTMLYSKDIHTKHSIAAWLIVFSTMEIILMFEKMHLIQMAIYISMFKKVTLNFVKLTLLLAWLIIAFGVSFYLLFHITSGNDTQNIQVFVNGENETDFGNKKINVVIGGEEDENPFGTYNVALLKTLAMSTGEFDLSDIDFGNFPLASRLLFVVFLFTVFLVAMNLLNGIAISDIQIIQNDASKYQIRDQVESIIKFDQLKPIYKWLGCIKMWKKSQIFECCFPDKIVSSIRPNRHYFSLWVRCKGHKDFSSIRFYFLRVRKWFQSLLKNIRDCQCITCCNEKTHLVKIKCKDCKQRKAPNKCSICGEVKNVCQDCQAKIQQEEHICIYRHKYNITSQFVSRAKQINEEQETIEENNERKRTEEFHQRKLNHINIRIDSIERQQLSNEKRLQKIEESIENLNKTCSTNSEIKARLTNMENNLEAIVRYIKKT